MIKQIRKAIDSANINFLLGSGLSKPYLDTLNEIEEYLSDSSKTEAEIILKKKEYFTKVMLGNLNLIDGKPETNKDAVLENYKNFYKILNNILLRRENSILTKQVNVFTTNIDVFSEMALEETGVEFNDGFHGRFNPVFNLGNFKKSYFQKSLHYENTSEIPVFNIIKLHGSLNWKFDTSKAKIHLDRTLDTVRIIDSSISKTTFVKEFDKLIVVNPTKEKFKDTLIKQYYYDLLRIYSNELEKENSILFVMGFSFADEHIKDLTERVAGSNPTLKIYIFAYDKSSIIFEKMKTEAKNRNIEVLTPTQGTVNDFKSLNSEIFDKIISLNESSAEFIETSETDL